MRIAWRAVGWICARVLAEQSAKRDLFADLRRLGFDELSVRTGQRYLTGVVDHDSGRLLWAQPGRDRKTVEQFLELLGGKRCQQLTLVSCDIDAWIRRPLSERCPNAALCYDPYQLVKLASDALDQIRRQVCNETRKAGQAELATALKGARFALWKNPQNLTERQQ